jgi:protein involved in polysaccharide export with SLBB domain
VVYRIAISTALFCLTFLPLAARAQSPSFESQQPAGAPGLTPGGATGAGVQGVPVRITNTNNKAESGLPGAFSEGAAPAGALKKSLTQAEPNEFQKFVFEATGKLLPIYGADFFSSASMAPTKGAPVSGDYTLGPGDEVLIRAWGAIDIDYRAIIDRNGLINIPRVGTLSLAGVKSTNVEDLIRTTLGKSYRGFQLNVTLGQLRGITVYVVGQARQPGTYTVSSLSTVITALSESGGVSANGSFRHVQLKRAGRLIAEIDLYAFLAKGDKSADMKLIDGDVIVVPARAAQVALTGEVETPAIYELRNADDDLRSVLEIAGGLPVLADPRRITLERIEPGRNQPRTVEELALDASGMSRKLRNGDLVSVVAISSEFANAITLRGAVGQALRLPFRTGMKITDVIPSKEFLATRMAIRRQNSALNNQKDFVASVGNLYDEVNWDYAVVERPNRGDLTVSLVPFDLGKALADPKGPDNLLLQAGDILSIFSADDVRIPIAKRRVFVKIEGEVKRPGVYQVAAGENLTNIILNAGGVTSDAYLFGTEFYRESVRKAQLENLDKLLRRLEQQLNSESGRLAANQSGFADSAGITAMQARQTKEQETRDKFLQRMRDLKPTGRMSLGVSPNETHVGVMPGVRLENGDRLVIPNRPDFVQIYGAVNLDSAIFWESGRTVSDYLHKAGLGPDSDKDALFVLRADGSVISNAGRWMTSVAGAEIYPGDIIVVPEKSDKESFWPAFTRYLKDYTQIFSNLGVGAAGIKILRQ